MTNILHNRREHLSATTWADENIKGEADCIVLNTVVSLTAFGNFRSSFDGTMVKKGSKETQAANSTCNDGWWMLKGDDVCAVALLVLVSRERL